MSLDQALKTLVKLGLTQADALIYVFLAKRGPHPEKDLADALKTNSQQLWQSLKKLQEKGFITSKTEKQTVFIAVPLEKIIDSILKAKNEEAKHMEQYKEKFLSNPNP